jgi:SAM-dependent methyltransferase
VLDSGTQQAKIMTVSIEQDVNEQHELDARNAVFWDTLCGANLARSMGITDHSRESLSKFDDRYFAFYPYLFDHIPFHDLRGRRVLEVGLGYGTVAQRIVESGADYTGLDISPGPVAMVNHRLQLNGYPGSALRGSILDAPFPEAGFDYVISIGCYHCTGDAERAFEESYRILRPRGVLVAMVYNAYSYRRWLNAFRQTTRYLLWDLFRLGQISVASTAERAAYDMDLTGNAPPFTEFFSRRRLRQVCRQFTSFDAVLRNIDQEPPFAGRSRSELMGTIWPSLCGLDVYIEARK